MIQEQAKELKGDGGDADLADVAKSYSTLRTKGTGKRKKPDPSKEKDRVLTAVKVAMLGDESLIEEHLAKEVVSISLEEQARLEEEARKNWDIFYKERTVNFFKDRHWLRRELPELMPPAVRADPSQHCQPHVPGTFKYTLDDALVHLEVGCGVGNTIFPCMRANPRLFCYATDFSPRAVEFVKGNAEYDTARCKAFVCDIANEDLRENVPEGSVDFITMLFVLSAIHPDKFREVCRNLYRTLKPGGVVFFRDYGRYDLAQLRFPQGHKLADNFYVRGDQTRSYYFSEAEMTAMFEAEGFVVDENRFVKKTVVNHKRGLTMQRIWIQVRTHIAPVLPWMPSGWLLRHSLSLSLLFCRSVV